jgi:hypothetical protein
MKLKPNDMKPVDINLFGEGYEYPNDFKTKVEKKCCKFTLIGQGGNKSDPSSGSSITYNVKHGKVKEVKLNDKLKKVLKEDSISKSKFLKEAKALQELAIKLVKQKKH